MGGFVSSLGVVQMTILHCELFSVNVKLESHEKVISYIVNSDFFMCRVLCDAEGWGINGRTTRVRTER